MHDVKSIADYLVSNDNYYIIVHKNPDGDCLGSAKALCLALRQFGKKSKVLLPNEVSSRLSFMWDTSLEDGDFPCDTAVCVDVASFGQMGSLYESDYQSAPRTLCIDHHGTNDGYADFSLVDGTAAATGELIYDILCSMGTNITREIATAILVAVADDTGSFQYSNTTAKTHLVASELYKIIPDPEPVMRALYGTHTLGEIEVLKAIIPTLEYHMDGKVCILTADTREITALGAEPSSVDAWVGLPRSVKGVEVAVIIKIHSENEVKVSFRSNDYVDVSALATQFGGGGHMRAAGATFFEGAESVKEKILKEIEKVIYSCPNLK